MVWVNKRLLWTTRQKYRWSQNIPHALLLMDNVFSGLESFKLPCYLPISGSSYKIITIWITVRGCQGSSINLRHVTECLFPRKSRKSGPHWAAWISCFINTLIHIRFIRFWINIIKKELYEPATVELEYFHIPL